MHHIKVAVLGQPFANGLIDHRLHIGRHHRQAKAVLAQRDAGVAFRTALHAALARQQKDVVVVENFHGPSSRTKRWVSAWLGTGCWLDAGQTQGFASTKKKPGTRILGPVADSIRACLQSGHVPFHRVLIRAADRTSPRLCPAARPQRRAARRCVLAARARSDIGGCGLGQNPGVDHPHCLVVAKWPVPPRWGVGGDLHQQSRQRNADPFVSHAAGQCAGHVDWHLSRPVQSIFARPLEVGQLAPVVPNFGHPRPTLGHQAAIQTVFGGRRTLSGQANPVVHCRLQRRRVAPTRCGSP